MRNPMRTRMLVAVIVVFLLAPVSLWAHHAFAAEFDATKPVKLRGTVTKMEVNAKIDSKVFTGE